MKTSTKALMWEQARICGVIVAWLVVVGSLVLSSLWMNITLKNTIHALDLSIMALIVYMMITFLGALLLVLRTNTQGHLTFQFEPHHFRLPVATATLTRTIFLTRLLFMIMLCIILWVIVQSQSVVAFPSWFLLLSILIYAILQALGWSYRTVTWVGYVLAALFLVLPMIVVCVLIYEINIGHTTSPLLRWVITKPYGIIEVWGFVPVLLLSYLFGWMGVHLSRLGLTRGPLRFYSLLRQLKYQLFPEAWHFSSPFAAQLWYEWRRIGYLLPTLSAVVFIGLLLVNWLLLPIEEIIDEKDLIVTGFYAQIIPLLAVFFAAMFAGAIAIRPRRNFTNYRPLPLRLSALALLLAQWKALMLTLAVAMPLSVLGFVLFDPVEVHFLWEHYTADLLSTAELLSIFLAPLLLTTGLAWIALWMSTRYMIYNLMCIWVLWLLIIPRKTVEKFYFALILWNEEMQSETGAGFLNNFLVAHLSWFRAFYMRFNDIFFLFFLYNTLLLSCYMVYVARKRLFQCRDWCVLLVIWFGLAGYLVAFANFGFALPELMLIELGKSAFLIAPFVMLPLIQQRRRVR